LGRAGDISYAAEGSPARLEDIEFPILVAHDYMDIKVPTANSFLLVAEDTDCGIAVVY